MSLNESLSFFTPTYQRPKENVDFPNFDLFGKTDQLYSDEDYDSSILRGLKKSFKSAQQIILEEGVKLDNSKSDLLEASLKHADITKNILAGSDHSQKGHITNRETNELKETNESPEDQGRIIQLIFTSDIEEKFFHLVTDKIVRNERGQYLMSIEHL